MLNMNRLSVENRTRVVSALVEGNSIRFTSTVTGIARNTITRLLVDLGAACMKYHDKHVRNVRVRRLQCNEICSYIGGKTNSISAEKTEIGWVDVLTWFGIDADTKLVVSYLVGGRGADWAMDLMQDCANRIRGRVKIATDGHKTYLEAVEGAFGMDCDYAQLHRIYGASLETETRYSPDAYIGCDMRTVIGDSAPNHVSTSYMERQNLNMGMGRRRFTRLTHGFSKKLDNHACAVALHLMYQNFVHIHSKLHVTPAMEAGLSSYAWTINDLVANVLN